MSVGEVHENSVWAANERMDQVTMTTLAAVITRHRHSKRTQWKGVDTCQYLPKGMGGSGAKSVWVTMRMKIAWPQLDGCKFTEALNKPMSCPELAKETTG